MQEIDDVMGTSTADSEGNNGGAGSEPGEPDAEPRVFLSPHHLRLDYLFSKMMSLTCYQTTRNENCTFTDFLEGLVRMVRYRCCASLFSPLPLRLTVHLSRLC